MAKVQRVGLFRRQIIEHLSPAGIDALLAAASRISEGQLSAGGQFFGSTMITVDLQRLSHRISDACDQRTATRLAGAMSEDRAVLERLAARGRAEALRIAACPLCDLQTEVRLRVDGARLFIDVDVEGRAEQVVGQRGLASGAQQGEA